MNRRTLIPAFAGAASSKFLVALLLPVLVVVLALSGTPLHAAESAGSLFKHGQAAEAREDWDGAYNNYQKAYTREPKDMRYRTALYRVRVPAAAMHLARARKLEASGETQAAISELLHASEIDPSNEAVQQEIGKIRTKAGEAQAEAALPQPEGEQEELAGIGSPTVLKPLSDEPLTLHMTEDAKVIYQAVGKAAGVNVLFDPDYTSKRVQVDLNNVSLVDALRIVGTMSNTFWRPITANTIFVAQNTRVKRTEMDEQAVQTFYLSNAWQQNDLNDVQTALRNVMPNAKVYGVAGQNAIVMRGTPDELLLAQKLIDDLDKARAEVVVDIAIMEVSKNWERTLGISWPSSVAVALQSTTTSSSTSSSSSSSTSTTSTTTPTLYDLAHITANNFAVTVGSATLNMLLTDSDTTILQSPRIRATDAQKATMKIGSRIPIATGSYSTGTAATTTSALVNTQFQYLDVGVNIEMTPTIHFDREVTLKIKIEVSSESGTTTISDVVEPIISQRVIDQVIRLREGEASILGGIQDNQESTSWTGIPGLSSIPLLKYIFGSKDHTIKDDDLVFVVVPHIVRSQDIGPSNLRAIDTGSGQTIELRRKDTVSPAAPPTTAPAARPVAAVVAPIQAQSAEGATHAALAQMHDQNRIADGTPLPTPTATVAPVITPVTTAQPAAPTAPATAPATGLSLTLTPPSAGQLVNGSTFQVPILVNGGTDIASVPVQLHYDAAKLSLANVAAGDLLSRDGQAVALIHRDDGPGNLTVVASRPPGSSGVNGSGVVCVLSFQARATGHTSIAFTRAGVINSAQQPVAAPVTHLDLEIK
jgi:general secretion pathway protein D